MNFSFKSLREVLNIFHGGKKYYRNILIKMPGESDRISRVLEEDLPEIKARAEELGGTVTMLDDRGGQS